MGLINYKFQKGDLVEIPSMSEDYFPNKGEVIDYRFALCSLGHRTLKPQKYVTVMLKEIYDFGEGQREKLVAKIEFPENKVKPLQNGLEPILLKFQF